MFFVKRFLSSIVKSAIEILNINIILLIKATAVELSTASLT